MKPVHRYDEDPMERRARVGRRRRWIAGALLFTIAVLAISYPRLARNLLTCANPVTLGNRVLYYLFPFNDTPSLAEVEKCIGASFPPESRLLGSTRNSWLEQDIKAKVRVSEAGIDELVRHLPAPRPPEEFELGGALSFTGYEPLWWDPPPVRNMSVLVVERHDSGDKLFLGIEHGRGQCATVYLNWWGD